MALLGTMTVNIGANIAGLTAGTTAAKAQLAQVAGGGALVAGALLAVGAVAIGAGAQAVKMAGDFQAGMTSLVTGAGESQKNIGMVSQGILDLAIKTGTSTKQLTDGMYMIESAGYHGAAGLQILQSAAEGAKVGNADLGTVANAVTTVLTDYHMPASQAVQVTNALITTVAQGKTHMQDLASSMGSVLPLASSLGISFPQVGGAIATMTNAGMDAQRASQNLANAIRNLSAPNATAAKSLLEVGLSAQQVSSDLSTKGLAATIQEITDAVGKKFPAGSELAKAALKSIMGGATGLNVAMMLGNQNITTFKSNVDSISKSMNAGGNAVLGWNLVQQDFNFKMQQAQEVLEVTGIKIGTALLPVVTQLTAALGFLVGVGTNVVSFFNNNQTAMTLLLPVLGAVAGVIGGILVAALVAGAIAAWAFIAPFLVFAAPFILIGAIIGAVVVVVILAIQHWGQIVAWLQGVWQGFTSWFMGILGAIGSFFVGLWNGIATFFVGVWNGIVSFLTGVWNGIVSGLRTAWGGIVSFFVGVWNGIIAFLQTAWGIIVNIIKIGAMLALAVLFAPIVLMVAAFVWLYNHNYYFKDLVDAIVNFFKGCFTWSVGAWQGFVGWLGGLWNGTVSLAQTAWNATTTAITVAVTTVVNLVKAGWQAAVSFLTGLWHGAVGLASSAWNAVSSVVMGVVNPLVGWLRGVWQGAVSNLAALWGTISGYAASAWNAVVSVFNSAWGWLSAALSNIWTQFSSWFGNLANQALTWGANVIKGFISGIQSALSGIGTALAGAAQKVAAFLGFHSPTEEGPGREADTWAPNFINMYAAGLIAGIPTIQNAMKQLMAPIEMSASSSIAYPTQSASSAAVLAAVAASHAVSSSNQQPQEWRIYIDGKEATDHLGPHIARYIRGKGVRNI